jgi:hypothetical protein
MESLSVETRLVYTGAQHGNRITTQLRIISLKDGSGASYLIEPLDKTWRLGSDSYGGRGDQVGLSYFDFQTPPSVLFISTDFATQITDCFYRALRLKVMYSENLQV